MGKKYVRVAVDAMGGDLAPAESVKGAVQALGRRNSLHITLVGKEEVIREELSKYKYPEDRLISASPSIRCWSVRRMRRRPWEMSIFPWNIFSWLY